MADLSRFSRSRFSTSRLSAGRFTGGSGSGPEPDLPTITVTDGDITTFARGGVDYTQVVWRQGGSFTLSGDVDAQWALVGGGGSGGRTNNNNLLPGGGGAGGLLQQTSNLPAGSYDITIGAGAPRITAGVTSGDGSDSAVIGPLGELIAFGGGYGATAAPDRVSGGDGGSGGGSRAGEIGFPVVGGPGVSGQGFAGGRNWSDADPAMRGSGGGGGSGGVAIDATAGVAGVGGPGVSIDWMDDPVVVCRGGDGILFDTSGPSDDAEWGGGSRGAVASAVGAGGDGAFVIVFRSDDIQLDVPYVYAIGVFTDGQSNGGDREMLGDLVWSFPPRSEQILSPNDHNPVVGRGGVRGWGGANPNVATTALIPSEDIEVQSIYTAIGAGLTDLWTEGDLTVIGGTVAQGAQGFYGTGAANTGLHLISPPTRNEAGEITSEKVFSRHFTTMITRVVDCVSLSRVSGKEVDRAYITFTHQEAEAVEGVSRAEYLIRWLDYKADIEAHLSGLEVEIIWLLDQAAGGGSPGTGGAGNAWPDRMSVYDASLPENDGSNVYVTMPRYWLQLGDLYTATGPDVVHHSYEARVLQGEVISYAINAIESGGGWSCAWPNSLQVVGNTVVIDFSSELPLVLDDDYIPIQSNYGFTTSGVSANIVEVQQTGDRQITVTFDGDPSGGFLRYAYRPGNAQDTLNYYPLGTGGVREEWAVPSQLIPGQTLYRPALGWEFPI